MNHNHALYAPHARHTLHLLPAFVPMEHTSLTGASVERQYHRLGAPRLSGLPRQRRERQRRAPQPLAIQRLRNPKVRALPGACGAPCRYECRGAAAEVCRSLLDGDAIDGVVRGATSGRPFHPAVVEDGRANGARAAPLQGATVTSVTRALHMARTSLTHRTDVTYLTRLGHVVHLTRVYASSPAPPGARDPRPQAAKGVTRRRRGGDLAGNHRVQLVTAARGN